LAIIYVILKYVREGIFQDEVTMAILKPTFVFSGLCDKSNLFGISRKTIVCLKITIRETLGGITK
jgi:hypothetical protein